MKKTILILSLGFLIFSCGDGESTREEKQLSEEGSKPYSEEGRYSEGGLTVVEYNESTNVIWKNGEIFEEDIRKILMYYDGDIDDDHLVKIVRYYEEKYGGGKESEENYKNGYKDGKSYLWDKNGEKQIESNYKDGELEGKQLKYHGGDDGLIDEESYYKNGKRDGELKFYDHWNNIMGIMTYKEGIEVSDTIIPMK